MILLQTYMKLMEVFTPPAEPALNTSTLYTCIPNYAIIDFVKKSSEKEFIIGTENSILKHLEYECPDKSFYVLSKALVCPNMMLTTLPGLYKCCTGEGGEEIILDEDIRLGAKRCIDRMIELEGNVR